MNTIEVHDERNDIRTTSIFFNQSFDKKRLKAFLDWVLKRFGEKEGLIVVEQLKSMGFYNATKAGLSIGLYDLKTPYKKPFLISHAQRTISKTDQEFQGAEVTATERSQRIIDTWHRTSEDLRKQVVDYFSAYDQLNSVYMMALSGARGNFSQVRQLIGMRGLMADPQGQIISFPIRSNLREGLTLTEYFISCSGARKGLVDTALRTADTGYLTRRLVDISHHIVVKKVTCYTSRGIALKTLRTSQKILLALRDRLIGRVLAEDIYDIIPGKPSEQGQEDVERRLLKMQPRSDQGGLATWNSTHLSSSYTGEIDHKNLVAKKNQEISPDLAFKISQTLEKRTRQQNLLQNAIKSRSSSIEMEKPLRSIDAGKDTILTNSDIPQVLVRSPLTCAYTDQVCQLCYGWSMAQGSLVSLGEAVGVIAGQSIGEPGTQLTMRTFHTGGVFSGDLLQEIRAPHSGKILFPKALQGLLIRTSQGKIAFLIKVSGELLVDNSDPSNQILPETDWGVTNATKVPLAPSTILFVRQGETVEGNQILAELAITSQEGNQPIKSRQTLFSEMRGRIVQWKSMSSRIHRRKGIFERSYNKTGQNLENKERSQVRTKTVKGGAHTKAGVAIVTNSIKDCTEQACLGPPDRLNNASYPIVDRSLSHKPFSQSDTEHDEEMRRNFDDLRTSTKQMGSTTQTSGVYVNEKALLNKNTKQRIKSYAYRSSMHNNVTLKNIVLAKKHGFGSIEPPKALKLGVLGVIATRAGASERTSAKVAPPELPRFSSNSRLSSTLKSSFLFHLHRLNTVADEGDLVDENYTTIESSRSATLFPQNKEKRV